MKQLKWTLSVFTLVAGLGFVLAFAPKENGPDLPAETDLASSTLYWFTPDLGSYMGQNTIVDEQNETGCTGGGDLCEKGFRVDQLVNPSNPSQGVKSGQTPQATIRRV